MLRLNDAEVADITLAQLRDYIRELEYRRDFVGLPKSDMDRLATARTELVRRRW